MRLTKEVLLSILTTYGIDIVTEIKKNQEIVERIKELNLKLILQHIRDSFSEDRELMSVEAQKKTVKCIEDLMKLEKILVI